MDLIKFDVDVFHFPAHHFSSCKNQGFIVNCFITPALNLVIIILEGIIDPTTNLFRRISKVL